MIVDPHNRPSAEDILALPSVMKRTKAGRYTEHFQENVSDYENCNIELLGTIRLPSNLKMLAERLPGSNYGTSLNMKKRQTAQKSNRMSIQTTEEALSTSETSIGAELA